MISAPWKKSKIALLPFHAERKRWFYKLCGVAGWLAALKMMEKCPARHTVFLFLCQIAFLELSWRREYIHM